MAGPSSKPLGKPVRVGLFVTCLADLFRPAVAQATVTLLEQFGCEVDVPTQSCCGQPAYNSGESDKTRALALNFSSQFSDFDYIVAPSGSCAAMVRCHYPELFPEDSEERTRVQSVADKTWELSQFLLDVLQIDMAGESSHESAADFRIGHFTDFDVSHPL